MARPATGIGGSRNAGRRGTGGRSSETGAASRDFARPQRGDGRAKRNRAAVTRRPAHLRWFTAITASMQRRLSVGPADPGEGDQSQNRRDQKPDRRGYRDLGDADPHDEVVEVRIAAATVVEQREKRAVTQIGKCDRHAGVDRSAIACRQGPLRREGKRKESRTRDHGGGFTDGRRGVREGCAGEGEGVVEIRFAAEIFDEKGGGTATQFEATRIATRVDNDGIAGAGQSSGKADRVELARYDRSGAGPRGSSGALPPAMSLQPTSAQRRPGRQVSCSSLENPCFHEIENAQTNTHVTCSRCFPVVSRNLVFPTYRLAPAFGGAAGLSFEAGFATFLGPIESQRAYRASGAVS